MQSNNSKKGSVGAAARGRGDEGMRILGWAPRHADFDDIVGSA